ncbi:DUF2130 domain-containing protein [Paraflavitalea sp. CAU 1676]|uniref:DUF2130 domain-containing protein n=1 Tax=Paraflavitalea sp. CAU 1676 TaxID=3032598 RepID=UPI0023DCAECA|nr:DUF2130 domain-containing protein [Paraflavitalea sp. CAU 1676]MDF2191828.1 DUF2130 domain-containing protein [Paraflavitalea sp. CAU 1676]
MATDIKCPKCGHQFDIEDAVSEEYKKELREQMVAYKKQLMEESAKEKREQADLFARREKDLQQQAQTAASEYNKKLQEEKVKLQQTLEVNLRKTIGADYENQLSLLTQNNKDNEEKLKLARQKELEFLKKEQDLKNKEAELELSLQRKLQEERARLSDEIRKMEEEKNANREFEHQLKQKELEKQLEDQKRLIEEMKRKAEQGSMQLQGEVQELALEEMLTAAFPFDMINEVGKGIRGADCIQTIRNQFGQECGRIIYESKRTKHFDKAWIEKLKADMRSTTADVAVIVTQAMPEQLNKFGQVEGIWVCTFGEVIALSHVLRDGIIKIYNASKSQENRGDKMHLLYDYLTSNEFGEQWKAIREGFQSMKMSIQRERDAMEKLWKAREKQLEKVLLNAAHIKGSIEGIAGSDNIQLNLLDEPDLLEE